MTLALNTTSVIPSGPDLQYTVTRPPGCTPASTVLSTKQIACDYLSLGALTPAPKGVSLHVKPVTATNGHVGICFNAFGSQYVDPPVFGEGVHIWTHGNGIFFNYDGTVYTESWHVNPGTNEATSGAWFDSLVIGSWIPGHSYQVDALLYADGHYVFRILDLDYTLNAQVKPNSNAIEKFFSTNASPTDTTLSKRIRAKSVNGRTNKVGAFIAGAGCSISVTPVAIFN
jgi:hypothetical protein